MNQTLAGLSRDDTHPGDMTQLPPSSEPTSPPIPDGLWHILRQADARGSLFSRSARLDVDAGGRVLFANVAGLRVLRSDVLQEAMARPLLTLAPKLRPVLQAARGLRVGQSVRAGAFRVTRRPGLPARLSLEADGPGSGPLRDDPTLADLERRLGLGPLALIAGPSGHPQAADAPIHALVDRARRDGAVRADGHFALATPLGVLVFGIRPDATADDALDAGMAPTLAQSIAWRLDPDDRVMRGPDALVAALGDSTFPDWLSDEAEREAGSGRAALADAIRGRRAFVDLACRWPVGPGETAPARVSARPIFRPDGRYRGLRGETRLVEIDDPMSVQDVPATPAVATEAESDRAVPGVDEAPGTDLASTEEHGDGGIAAEPLDAGRSPSAASRDDAGLSSLSVPLGTEAAAGPSMLKPRSLVEDEASGEVAALSSDERDAFDQIASLLRRNENGSFGPAPSADWIDRGAGPDVALGGEETSRRVDPVSDAERLEAMLSRDAAGEGGNRAFHEDLDAVPLALVVYRDDQVLFLNRAAGRMLRYGSAEELALHGGVEALFEAGDGVGHDPQPAGSRAGVPTRRILRADGVALDLVTALRTIRWKGATAFLLTIRRPDILDGDNGAPHALPANALLGVLPLGVLSLGGDGTVHSANPQAGALLGLDVDRLIGTSLTALLCEPHRRDVLDDLHALMRGELRPARPVIGLGSSFGSPFGASSSSDRSAHPRTATSGAHHGAPDLDLTLRRIDLGGGYGLVALLQDARERKAEGEARRRAEAELARLHQERGAFLKRISHELRTPLNAIVGFSEVMMEERFGALGSVRYRDYAHDIQESGRRLIGMIGDLMDLVRLQESQAENGNAAKGDAGETDARIGLNEIVTACVSNVYARAGERRVIIRCSLAQGLPAVRADRESLSQIVANLLDNSVRLTQPGGQVIVSTRPLDDGGVAVRVRDGARLDAAALKAAVSPFDLELETTPADGAPSLGLPLTRALAQANGADFTIDSEAGRGTITQVLFPPGRVIAA